MSHPGQAGQAGPAEVGLLVEQAMAAGDPTGWFEPLYAAAERGAAVIPWDRGNPHWLVVEWTRRQAGDGAGRRALVVGCGLGADAEHLAGLGFETTAFDISPSAIRAASQRFPQSSVRYQVADLLAPPVHWRQAFDLVVESQTIQALPEPPRSEAIERIADLVAPGGTLVVVALAREERDDPGQWPPWPITRAEIDGFARAGLAADRVEMVEDDGRMPRGRRWLAEFRRRSA